MKTLLPACFALAAFTGLAGAPSALETAPSGMAGKLIDHYHMQKVPQEGCWFSLSYSSDDQLDGDTLPVRYAGRPHAAGNAIVALETPKDFSAMHRLQTDEVWHFYDGAPIDLLLLYPDGHGQKVTLGAHVLAGELRQFTVPRGVWQGSAPRNGSAAAYSLFADQLSPGFDYADFEIGYRDALQRGYPAFARDIEHLTRAQFAVSPPNASRSAPSSDAATRPVGPGSTVFIPATVPHSIEANPGNDLVFLAISAPAFTPEDYVLVR